MTKMSPKRALMAGAFWTLAMRWSMKVIGFANTLVMARLLLPEDYGIVAMAMLIVGLIQACLDFSATTALLRRGAVTRDEIDSAWSLRMMEALSIALLVACVAWPASVYFEEPRVAPVLWILSVCIAINSCSNIGFTLAQKELNFSLEFKFGVTSKVLSVLVTLATGFWLRDYRALVCGVATGYIGGMLLSYAMHPYRPRWNTRCVREIWHETKWLMFASIAQFMLRKGDEVMASRIGTTQEYGLYNVGSDLGMLPTGEIGPAILKSFLPVLSTIQNDAERTNHAVLKTVSAVSAVSFPVGAVFAALAEPATRLLLGPNWVQAAVFVGCFSLISTLQVLCSPLGTLLVMRGHAKVQNNIYWVEFAIFGLAALLLVPAFSLMGLVFARIVGTSGAVFITAWAARHHCGLPVRGFAAAALRPLVGAALAAAAAWQVQQMLDLALLQLLAGALLAAVVYIAWAMLSWLAAGRPPGLESTLVDHVAARRAVGQRG